MSNLTMLLSALTFVCQDYYRRVCDWCNLSVCSQADLWVFDSCSLCKHAWSCVFLHTLHSPCSPCRLVSAIQMDSLLWFLHSCKVLALLLCKKIKKTIEYKPKWYICALCVSGQVFADQRKGLMENCHMTNRS